MEKRGIRFFEDNCVDQIETLERYCSNKEKEIKDQFGKGDLNINSDKQLIPYFYQQTNGVDTPSTSLALTPIRS